MNRLLVVTLILNWLILGIGCWLGWQLLRQNGRILLRLDELEKRLDELEFGDLGDAFANELHGRPRHFGCDEAEDKTSGAQTADVSYPDDRSSRFSNRSLGRSRIKRDGLKAGTSAPSFCLPRLDGRGDLSLEELRGRRVLLVFSDPQCEPCNQLAPRLEELHREIPEVAILMISRRDVAENRSKVKEHSLTFPVVLQVHWEISRSYGMFATPIAYLIDEAGVIVQDAAVGVEPILRLMEGAVESFREPNKVLP